MMLYQARIPFQRQIIFISPAIARASPFLKLYLMNSVFLSCALQEPPIHSIFIWKSILFLCMKIIWRSDFLLLILFFLIPFYLKAQNKNLGGWYMYYGNARFEESPFQIHFELQNRNHFPFDDLDQLLIRSGLQYKLNNQVTFTGGYAFVQSERIGEVDLPKSEHRIYQEVLLSQKIGTAVIGHRFRYEQRFVEETGFRTRFRYSIALELPVYHFDEGKKYFYLAAYNEIFIHGSKIRENPTLYDRNRVFLSTGLHLSPNLSFQLGWMGQVFSSFTEHQLLLSVHHNLDF